MRGTPRYGLLVVHQSGITPAHAGNTVKMHLPGCGTQDHPRTCGEHNRGDVHILGHGGSPPHMRGTLGMTYTDIVRDRITPAHAGNTTAIERTIRDVEDHPRTCGEH